MALAPYSNVSAHNDDNGALLNRTLTLLDADGGPFATEGVVSDAPAPDPYLYWFPAAQNQGKTPGSGNVLTSVPATQLITDLGAMVKGVGVFGCGLESQLESWYRFLIQPDPYQTIGTTKDSGGNLHGVWQGVDQTIIQERADFLRPDSIVLIVDLSDENDSEIDVRSIGGLGVNWMAAGFNPVGGTSACATDPGSPSCQSCAQGHNGSTDSQCKAKPTYTAINDWGYDLNLRHVHMKAKYGVDVQFPISRYVTGLTQKVVPDRNGEYPAGGNGSYAGTPDCVNPLFATNLPHGGMDVATLCRLTPGPRTPDLVFYAHIGGVPHELLHFTHGNPSANALTSADWVKILGKDPENFDYTGIDPHMIESYQPRAGIAAPGSANDADGIVGHDWITDQPVGVMGGHVLQVDREYACTFPLADANGNLISRDCTQPQNANFCDCPHMAGTVSTIQLPPICDPTTITKQVAAKAYPTVRELLLAKKLGAQGIVSSICPIYVAENSPGDPYYGYRPAVEMILDHLKGALTHECLPQALHPGADGVVACEILLQIPNGAAGTSGTCTNPVCPAMAGLAVPPSNDLPSFCQGLEDAYNQAGGASTGMIDPTSVPVCQLVQLSEARTPYDFQGGSCESGADPGWCYVTGTAAGKCSQAILFTKNALPGGAVAHLVCH
jgi:hypothetical protein